MRRKIKSILILATTLLLTIMTNLCFAASDLDSSKGGGAEAQIVSVYQFLGYISIFFGTLMIIKGGYLLKEKADNPNSNALRRMTVTFMVAGLLIGYTDSITTIGVTLFGDNSKYCMYLDATAGGDCWDAKSSELTGEMRAKIEAIGNGSDLSNSTMRLINILVGVFQTVGFGYFLKSALAMKDVGNGNRAGGYGKPVFGLLFAVSLINTPAVISLIVGTIKFVYS